MNLTDLQSFIHVVDGGSISAAARAESVPASTISRRITRLEDDLGVPLLLRSARSVTVTDDGRLLHARVASSIRDLADAEEALRDARSEPSGLLVITAPHDIGVSGWLTRLITDYRRRYPAVTVDIRLDNNVVDILADGIDVAVRAHTGPVPGAGDLMVRSFGTATGGFYASEAYLAGAPPLETPADLTAHAMVIHPSTPLAQISVHGPNGPDRAALPPFTLRVNDFALVLDLVLHGNGVGPMPHFVAEGYAGSGLVRVLPEWSTTGGRLSLIWPRSRHMSPRVRAFLDLAAAQFQDGAPFEARHR